MPLVAIAILNWNGKHWLEKFLPNVILYSQEATIYVIDNDSTDDSLKFLEQNFPTIKIIKNKKKHRLCRWLQRRAKADFRRNILLIKF